jgi:hypothetical protein
MSKIKIIEVRCSNPECKHWFRSPVGFDSTESFDSAILYGNKVYCPDCKTMTICHKENIRIRAEDGGFMENETI